MALPTREDHPRRLTARAGAARVAAAIALGASLLAVPSPATAQTQPFSDVAEGTYYSEPVARLADNDIFDGTECAPGLLCPETSIDRKTMAVWTVRALDGQDPAQASGDRFTDVDADSFHAPFIERMAELGVTAGCGDGTRFCPDRTVTRAQMAVFLTRAFSLVPGPDPGFTDVPAGAWYFDQLTALAASGITKGCGDGTRFCPGRDTTRAQMATFLYRALHRDEPETEDLKPPLGNFDVERLLAAAVTLDREAKCPLPDSPESLEDVAEVLRIADGCAIVEYLPLRGQTLQEVRAELFASDRTVHAVGSPLTDLQLVSLQDADYGQDPPPPYNEDEYDAGEWWHLDVLDAALLWNPDGWEYDDSSGNTRRISGWPDQADVIVTVIDTGVDDHRDFRSRLVESRGDGGQFDTWLDDDCHHSGDNAHGTHVSGLIAAEQGNGYATAGIAPLAQVLPINLLRESCYSNYPSYGNATASVWAAIDRGTYVINMSFRWYPEYDNQGADDVFKASLVVAQQQFDIVVVAAAGNCGNPKHFNVQNKFSTTKCPKGQNMRHAPQMYDSDELDVISVAAIRRDHRRTSFSTVNRDVDIAAPGHNLLSTHPTTCIISLCRDETVFMSGTSQAAPLVSGVVAHMRARYPQATPNEIATALYDTATHRPAVQTDSTGRSDKYGHGIINPKAAIEALDQMMWPDPITGPARYAEPFSRVAAGAIHTCALRDDDTVACWGDNQHGQADAPSGTFNAVSAGRYHSCALRTNGTLACWGLNDRGQADPPAGSDFRGVTSGGGHSCALKDDDTVACWGDNEHGQRETPAGRLIAISAGGDQSCAVRASGTVVCWGDPGSLPSSSIYDRFNAVSSGTAHSCGLRTDDSIGCWSGGLLDDSREVVTDVPSGTFTAISAHGNNACGLRSSGDITCWGEQLEGEVEGPFTAVTVGLFHMCATRPNGSVEMPGRQRLRPDRRTATSSRFPIGSHDAHATTGRTVQRGVCRPVPFVRAAHQRHHPMLGATTTTARPTRRREPSAP